MSQKGRYVFPLFLVFLPFLAFSDIPRILLIGDSWTAIPWNMDPPALRSVLLRPEWVQNLGGRYVEIGDLALRAGTASEWDTDQLKNEITQKLNEYPTIDIVHISLGGNDINVAWKYHHSWEQINSLLDATTQHIRNVVQHCLSVRPNIRVAICGYDYLNISEGYTWGTYTNPFNPFDVIIYVAGIEQPTQLALLIWEVPVIVFNPQYPWLGWTTIQQVGEYQAHLNNVFIELERRKKDLAISMDRVEYIHNLGLMQARMGIPSLGIGQNYSILPLGPSENYSNFPGGYANLFSPRQAMGSNSRGELDPIHLNSTGYIYLMENAVAQVYARWLSDSTPPFVDAILLGSDNPPVGNEVMFVVRFSENVRGVDISDFRLDARGTISGANILRVEGSGNEYRVYASVPTGNGSLSIDLIDNDTIYDDVWNPLAGMADGSFVYGQYYVIGTGEGGGGDVPSNCPLLPILDQQGRDLYLLLGMFWEFGDFDNNGMVDSWEVGPLAEVFCNPAHPLHFELMNAYNTTLRGIRSEPTYASLLQPVEHLLTSLLLLHSSMCSAVKNGLSAVLTKPYIPFVINRFGSWIEPFNPDTDIDLDGLNNRTEYNEVMNLGLPWSTRENYISAVLTPKCPEGIKSEFAKSLEYLYKLRINIPFQEPICLICKDPFTTDLDGNGIIDYAQALLLDLILACQNTQNYGIVAYCWGYNNLIIRGYLDLLWRGMSKKYWGLPVEQGIGLVVDLGKVEKALTGLATLGEPTSLAGIKAFFDSANQYLDPQDRFEVDISLFETSAQTVVGSRGDADGDGICNLSEYNAVTHDISGLAQFSANALNSAVRLNGGGCDGIESNNGEEPTNCPILDAIDEQGRILYQILPFLDNWNSEDWDSNGLIDSWECALLAYILCDSSSQYYTEARKKFTGNIQRLRRDSLYSYVRDFEQLLCLLMTVSQTFADRIKEDLGLTGYYYSFKLPPVNGEEICGAGGDPDDDTITNFMEYKYVRAMGGTREDYVRLALTPANFNLDRCENLCDPNQPLCSPVDFDTLMRNLQRRIRELGYADKLGGYSFDPSSTDINGGINETERKIYPNGILDSDEFALVNYLMTRNDLGEISQLVCAGWENNVAQMYADLGGASGLINVLAPEMHKILAGYMLLGDENSVAIPIRALTSAVNAEGVDLGVVVPDVENYVRLPQVLSYYADPDGDGFTNIEEYECFRFRSRCCYLVYAVDNNTFPDSSNCLLIGDEGEGISEGEGSSSEEGEGNSEGLEEGANEGEGLSEEEHPFDCRVEPCEVICDAEEPFVGLFENSLVAIYENSLVDEDPNTSDLDQNGIIDRYQARLVDFILADNTSSIHCCVKTAFEYNLAVAEIWANDVQRVQPIVFLLIPKEKFVRAVAGVMTIGERATIEIITNAIQESPVPVPLLEPEDFDLSAERFLAYYGDVDMDGVCNLGEYNSSNSPEVFIKRACNPQITEDGGGCPPCVEGEVDGEVLEGLVEGYIDGEVGPSEGDVEGRIEGEPNEEGETTEGESGDCYQYPAEGLPIRIEDGVRISSPIFVDRDFQISEIEVGVRLTHESIGQITLWLESPHGSRIYLASRIGGDYNGGFDKVVFDMNAPQSITNASPPYTGRYKPMGSFDSLLGSSSQGVWRLVVFDWISEKTGRLVEWRIVFNGSCEFQWGSSSHEDNRLWHSADTNRNWRIELTELLRVIQFFNSGGYHLEDNTEDGYAPGINPEKVGLPHHSDYSPQNWRIELSELLRLIQFFNSPDGYSRSLGSEDGFTFGSSGSRDFIK
ncbi:MAG: proprotein convertase P-domain-containing protein [Candidatus Hydrogenedentes bacterium]|nr:proprotein convertase P-domain-containing protein [Candidatus Hydrogenedentota bacterium]